MRFLRSTLGLTAALALGACGTTTADSTQAGVQLTITRDASLLLDAVRVRAFDGDREVVQETREADEGTLGEGETLPLVFDGAPDGAEVRIEVEGLAGSDVLATGEATATLELGTFVAAEVHLGGGAGGDAGMDAGGEGGIDAGADAGATDCDEGDTRECGATDVGECAFGTETCSDGVWGACEGEVEATDEECPADSKDQDCSGTNDDGDNACGGVCTLTGAPGDRCDAAGGGDADDCEEDVYVCNGRNATTCADHTPGVVEWVTSAGDVAWDQFYSMDLAGDAVFAVGVVSDDASGDTTVGGEVLETYGSGQSILVARFDATDGAIEWVASAGGTSGGLALDVAAAPDASAVYVTGQYTGSPAEFGTEVATDSDTTMNTYFLAKYEGTDDDGDGQGDVLWVVDAGGSGADAGRGVAVGPDGSVYVTGVLDNDIGVDTTFEGAVGASKVLARPCNGAEQLFVAKYSPAGEVLWVAGSVTDAAETTFLARGRGIDVDPAGNVYVTGSFVGFDFRLCDSGTTPGCPASTCFGSVSSQYWDAPGIYYHEDVFVAKYDSDGSVQWVTRAGNSFTTSAEQEYGLAVESDGTNVYVLGTFEADIAFCENPSTTCPSDQTLAAIGDPDMFIASYDASGAVFRWARGMGAAGAWVDPWWLALSTDGGVYVTGQFNTNGSAAQFGLSTEDCYSPLASNGVSSGDGFLARYESNGDLRWARRMGGTGWDEAHGVAVADDGTAFVAGHFNGSDVPFCHVASGCTVTATSFGMPDGFVARFAP